MANASAGRAADGITVPPVCWEKVYKNPIFQMAEREFLHDLKLGPFEDHS